MMMQYYQLIIKIIFYSFLISRGMTNKTPKVIVFDLDYTLWPFWVDTHVTPPFRKNSEAIILDSEGNSVICYPEVPDVLKDLHEQGYSLAVASRTGEIRGALQLMELLGWKPYFSHTEIYPGGKVTHLTKIKNHFDVEFKDIIFFDDEGRNIRDVSELGVLSIMVKNGITKELVKDGLKMFAKRK